MTTARKKKIGNTELHKKVLTCKTILEFKDFLNNSDSKAISKMARTVNNKGLLPLQLVDGCQLSKSEKKELRKILVDLATSHQYKSISDFLTADYRKKIIDRYQVKSDTILYQNLKIAFGLVNRVRRELTDSSTHPGINKHSVDFRLKIAEEIEQMREDEDRVDLAKKTYIESRAEQALKYKKGNCEEFAVLAWFFLKKMNPTIPAELWELHGGDHVYLVIGTGKDRVVCDPWAGKAFPFAGIPREMKGFFSLDTKKSYLNVCTFYNSKVHTPRLYQIFYLFENELRDLRQLKQQTDVLSYAVLGLFSVASVKVLSSMISNQGWGLKI